MTRGTRRGPGAVPVTIASVALVVAGCSAGGAGLHRVNATPIRSTRPSTPATSAPPPIVAATTPSTTSPPPGSPGWTPVSEGLLGVAVDQRSVTNDDGSQVTVARFHAGQVRFSLHVGSQDPPGGRGVLGADAGPSVSSQERALLLAAFNGGFKIASGSGGFEVDNQLLSPLIPGRASFVIDTDGSGHVGIWGQGLPAPGEQVLSVRQNLIPMIADRQPSPAIGDVSAWGATINNAPTVARSALGVDAHGNILYAASMSALPADLAGALLLAGAVTAMELDINPEWVQLALAPSAGAPLVAGVPGQNRPADQYLLGWTRDFVTVLATT